FRSLRVHMPRPSTAPYYWVIFGVIVYGAATELVQAVVNREPSLGDFGNDMLGAAFALLLHWRAEADRSGLRASLAGAAVLIGVFATQPLAWTMVAYVNRAIQSPLLWRPDSRLFAHF